MKEIEYYIESNTKIMKEKQKEYDKLLNEKHLAYYDNEMINLRHLIDIYKYYIQGLKDAKNYIEKENKQ